MRTATTLIVGAAMSCSGVGAASADFVGLAVVLESAGQMTAAGPRDVYRVYAEFTNPTDRIDAWYGTEMNPFTIQNVLGDGITLGSGFTNFGGVGGILPPEVLGTVRDWDTWATIGVAYLDEAAPEYLSVTPAFPAFISGNSLTANASSVFLAVPDAPQGQGNFRVVGHDSELRVLLMQLVVNVGEHVRGTINIDGNAVNSSTGLATPFTAINQSFSSVPGSGPLLVLVGGVFFRGRMRI